MDKKVYSVKEINEYVKSLFAKDQFLKSFCIRGEISNFKHHSSGHMYFSLKDEDTQIKGVMFATANAKLNFVPKDGMKVVCYCSLTSYPKDGTYQLYVTQMQQDGLGDLHIAFEELKKKLNDEGLFKEDHKIPLPKYPLKIGVVTSPTGAVIHDICNVIKRRFPIAEIFLYPSNVQGAEAAPYLIKGLEFFEKNKNVDVVIIGRGGGSIEDLWGFNDEKLARTIYSMTLPVVSAVGHEVDYTICDFVSDVRAPTPSAAAELIVPELQNEQMNLDDLEDNLIKNLKNNLLNKENFLNQLVESFVYKKPEKVLDAYINKIDYYESNIINNLKILFNNKSQEIDYYDKNKLPTSLSIYINTLENRLNRFDLNIFKKDLEFIHKQKENKLLELIRTCDALSPLKVMSRGYSLIYKDNHIVSSVNNLKTNDDVKIKLNDGEVEAKIK